VKILVSRSATHRGEISDFGRPRHRGLAARPTTSRGDRNRSRVADGDLATRIDIQSECSKLHDPSYGLGEIQAFWVDGRIGIVATPAI